MANILFIEDNPSWQKSLRRILETAGHTLDSANDFQTAIKRIQEVDFDVIVFDLFLGGDQDSEEPLVWMQALIEGLNSRALRVPPIIVITGYPISQNEIVNAFTNYRDIVYDFFEKASFETGRFLQSIKDATALGNRQMLVHQNNQTGEKVHAQTTGSNIFIGHGKSSLWKDLKDFIQDRLWLQWDEFNRIPVAGITNIARLSQMLDNSAIAFLIMTAEDELADGKMQARMNVIHEAGLFQGRLGFTKAIILLEDGCEEFSNIQGLGQIRFPEGNIKACFEEIRQVLEREDVIS